MENRQGKQNKKPIIHPTLLAQIDLFLSSGLYFDEYFKQKGTISTTPYGRKALEDSRKNDKGTDLAVPNEILMCPF